MKFLRQNSNKKISNINLFCRNKGFSLIEISVVFLVIGILIVGISRGVDLYADFKIQTAQKLTINSPVSRIDDLVLWLETTSEKSFQTKMINNSSVPQWNNISPFDLNIKNAYSYSSNPQPLYLENSINGLPAVQFKKSSLNCMQVESGFDKNTENITIFTVLVAKSVNTYGRILNKWEDINTPYPYALRQSFQFVAYAGPPSGSSPSTVILGGNGSGKVDFPYVIVGRRIKSGNLSIWTNGVKGVESLDNTTNSTTNNSPLYIACQGSSSSAGSYGDFNVGEIIIYSRALSNIEISRVSQYLSQKWNIKF